MDLYTYSKEEIKDILVECFPYTGKFARTFLHERFYRPFSSLNNLIFDILDDETKQQVVIAAPRGWGKTSTINFAYPAKRILYQTSKFIVPVSCTATQAGLQSENLKFELVSNQLIRRIFGNVSVGTVSDDEVGGKALWTKDMWLASGGTFVMPRGAGQQIRGVIYRNKRPDLIIVDDLENSESVMSLEQRIKLKEWFFADLCNSVNRDNKDWRIIVIGTVLHEDSLLQNLLDDPDWYSVRLELCDDNYKSNWPEYMTDDDVKKLAESYRRKGLLDTFYREYRNLPISREDASFKQSYFRYINMSEINLAEEETIIIIDPAKTVQLHSAETAIIGISLNAKKQRISIIDLVADKLHPHEIYEHAFAMADRIGAKTIGIEVTSLNEFITYPFRNEILKRKKYYINLVELKARDKKENRVKAMVPFYRLGYIYHNPACCGPLEAQLLAFPRPTRWDCMDAEAYFIEMFALGDRFFYNDPTDEEDADGIKGPHDDVEAEYAALGNEFDEELGDEWMLA